MKMRSKEEESKLNDAMTCLQMAYMKIGINSEANYVREKDYVYGSIYYHDENNKLQNIHFEVNCAECSLQYILYRVVSAMDNILE